MAFSDELLQGRSGTITLIDGTSGTPLEWANRFTNSDFSSTDLMPDMNEQTVVQARGRIIGVVRGAQVIPSISFSCYLTDFSETATGTPLDFLSGKAGTPYAARVRESLSIDHFNCAVKVQYDNDGDGTADNTLTFHGVVLSYNVAEQEDGPVQVSFSGSVYGDGTNIVSGDITIPVPA